MGEKGGEEEEVPGGSGRKLFPRSSSSLDPLIVRRKEVGKGKRAAYLAGKFPFLSREGEGKERGPLSSRRSKAITEKPLN